MSAWRDRAVPALRPPGERALATYGRDVSQQFLTTDPMPIPTGNPSIRCLGCGASMIELDYGPAYLDQCPSCSAVWFDSTELQALLEGRDSDRIIRFSFRGRGTRTEESCPRCEDDGLRTEVLGEVTVEWCEACRGLFVPGRALELLRRTAPRRHLDDRAQGGPAAEIADLMLVLLSATT